MLSANNIPVPEYTDLHGVPYYDYQNDEEVLATYNKLKKKFDELNHESFLYANRNVLCARLMTGFEYVANNKYNLLAHMESIAGLLDELSILHNHTLVESSDVKQAGE